MAEVNDAASPARSAPAVGTGSKPTVRSRIAERSAPAVPTTEWLRPWPPATRFIFHGDAVARAAAATAWPAPFSEESCRALVQGSRATLWLGPDEYLLISSAEESPDSTAAALTAALRGVPHALVDVSHRQTGFAVHGPHAAAILNGGCPLDLDLAEFPPGMCTRTVFAKAEIVLWRKGAELFHVEVARSFTAYVTGFLDEVARGYGLPRPLS